jgi:hypothetical protein
LCSQRQQCEQVKGEFKRQPTRTQFKSNPSVTGHLGNSRLPSSILDFKVSTTIRAAP